MGTITFSAKRSNPHAVGDAVRRYAVGMQYTVGVSAKKVNSHSGLRTYGWWGPLPLVEKGQTPYVGVQYAVGAQYAVGMQCAVSVSAKRSNMGGGCCDTAQNDTIGKIELFPSIVLSSRVTNYKNDIHRFL